MFIQKKRYQKMQSSIRTLSDGMRAISQEREALFDENQSLKLKLDKAERENRMLREAGGAMQVQRDNARRENRALKEQLEFAEGVIDAAAAAQNGEFIKSVYTARA